MAEVFNSQATAGVTEAVARSAARASEWLQHKRPYAAGWGFNGLSGADSDSTGWAIQLIRAVGGSPAPADIEFLLSHMRPDGGFATFDGPKAWGFAHPDVTPTVFLALPSHYRSTVRDQVARYVRCSRSADGTWPSYWWRTCHYSTFVNSLLIDTLGMDDDLELPLVRISETHGIHSAFDLACLLGMATTRKMTRSVIRVLSEELLRLQRTDGSWPGAPNLRVTDPECTEPWVAPRGRLYVDGSGLITTATALRALVRTGNGNPPD
jgi:hypothetical protein